MAVTVSELFKEYEDDFKRLEHEIDSHLENSREASDDRELQCLKEGEKIANKADQSLRQMEMEAKTLPTDQRSVLDPKLKRYRADLLERRKALQDAKEMASRKSLLGDDGNGGTMYGKSMKDRERAMDAKDKMQRDADRLAEAKRLGLETEQIGMDVMSDLKGQRDTIMRTKANVGEVGANYGTAKKLLEGMLWRAKANRLITCAAMLFLLVFSAVAAWMFLGGGGGGYSTPYAATSRWAGKYSDPAHPGCKREISVADLTLNIAGTEGTPGPGCGPNDVERSWSLSATLSSADTEEVVIDFSAKGGPSGVRGTWDGDGIKFSDGNKWTKN